MKKIKWYQTVIAIGVLLICFLLFWGIHGIALSVDKTVEALDCRLVDGETQERKTEISVSGKYRSRLWGADSFSGKIAIEGYEQTEGEVWDLRIEENAVLIYRKYDGARLKSDYFGTITVGNQFSGIRIIVDDGEGIDPDAPEHIIDSGE